MPTLPVLPGGTAMALGARFSAALLWAVELHAQQQRKVTGTPYVGHLLAVTGVALQCGANEDEAIAAVLHDALEDQGRPGLSDEIAARFGAEVLSIVEGCSDTTVRPKPPWQQRKLAYLQRLETAPPSVRLVKAADALDNCRCLLRDYRTLGEALWQHFRGGRDGTLWYHRSVVDILRRGGSTPLVEELARAVAELEKVAGGR